MLWLLALGCYAYLLIAKPQYRHMMYPLTSVLIVGVALFMMTKGVARNGITVGTILLSVAILVNVAKPLAKR